jgi:methylenetetrahydrofolate dehydrogenase (NADP+)/methenyltetrahydrofolate cyclohydrolase
VTAAVLDGEAAAQAIFADVARRIDARVAAGGCRPLLAVVLVGDDPASATYVRMKRRNAERVGIGSADHHLPATATTADVLALVAELNADPDVSGILVQSPPPPQVDEDAVMAAIDPAKDVDGLTPASAGLLALGTPRLVPCTPAGIVHLLERSSVPIAGRDAVVIGRSNLVGKPVAQLLLQRHATVTICHSRTADLAEHCRRADILIAAVGRTYLVQPAWVKPGAAVVDVGTNRLDSKLVGDVAPEVAEVAGWLTPNPGGVGPMTRAMLLRNTLQAEEARRPLQP